MTVSDQIIQVLDNLCERFGMAVDWTSENVTPVIKDLCSKLIQYEIWTSVVTIGFMVIIGIVLFVLAKKFFPIFKAKGSDPYAFIDANDAMFISTFLLIVFYVAAVIIIGYEIMDIVKCVTFPELHIIEYIQSLIETAK